MRLTNSRYMNSWPDPDHVVHTVARLLGELAKAGEVDWTTLRLAVTEEDDFPGLVVRATCETSE